jgi:adenylate cyclase
MGKEIERKFLVHPRKWSDLGAGLAIRQGYLCATKSSSVRVRTYGDRAYVTIKGSTSDITRDEYEYEIPLADANEIMDHLCEHPPIEKTRYRIVFKGHTFEVDEFAGANRGLTVAEVELKDAREAVDLPDWIDREVSGDPRYYNSNLSNKPFSTWK